jgi:hypothetical protein
MSALIGALRVSLSADTAAFEAGMKRSQRQAQTSTMAIQKSLSSIKAVGAGFIGALTVGFLAEQIKKSLDYAGSLAEVSRTLGVTTKDLQTFRFAATQSGVAQDELEVGLRRLTVSMGKAELGSQAQAKAFGAIGISVQQLKGKNTGEVFRLMADGLSKVKDRAQRAAIEMTLMGRSGSTLDNLLAPGAKRLNDLADAAQRLGIVLSDQQIQGAEETAHKLEAVKTVLAAQIAGVVASNAGAILSLSSALASLTAQIIRFLGSNPQLALGIIGALAGGRVGGLPGAAAGAVGGIFLGGKLAKAQIDSSTDINVRKQQLRNALANYQAAKAGGSGDVRDQPGFGSTFGGPKDFAAAKAEVIRQTDLLNAAARAQAGAKPAMPQGGDLPKFLGGGGGGGGGKAKKAAKGPADRSDDIEFQFAQQLRQADDEILQGKLQLSHDITEQAAIQLQMIDLQKQARDAEIEHKVRQAQQDYADGRITKSTLDEITAQAAVLKAKEDEAANLQKKAVLDERDRALIQQQEEIDSHYLEIKQGLLQKQADLATTQAERRKIELELLEIAYKEKKQALDRLLQTSTDAATIENARNDLANLNANHALNQASVMQQTRGPLETYLQGIPHTIDQTNEALQNLEVQGLDGLATALSHIGEGWKAMRDIALQTIQEILQAMIKMQIEKMFFSLLGQAAAEGLLMHLNMQLTRNIEIDALRITGRTTLKSSPPDSGKEVRNQRTEAKRGRGKWRCLIDTRLNGEHQRLRRRSPDVDRQRARAAHVRLSLRFH